MIEIKNRSRILAIRTRDFRLPGFPQTKTGWRTVFVQFPLLQTETKVQEDSNDTDLLEAEVM